MFRNTGSSAFIAAFVLASILLPGLALGNAPAAKPLSEEQKILHVLNRLGFGPRPGDVARIRKIGIKRYIEQQLDPASLDDSAAEEKVRDLEVFNMTTAEIFAKYPNPGALLRRLEGVGRTPPAGQEEITVAERRERQRQLAEYYRKHGLRPAQQLLPQIVANRVLRAVYSERQLQEVMVDFWQNHFNVFSGKAAVRWYIPSYERDVLRKHALGNFRDLVTGTAQHPAMLFFLDNFQSVAPATSQAGRAEGPLQRAIREGNLTPQMRARIMRDQGITEAELDQRIARVRANANRPPARRGLNENYARELMELHTLGVDGGYTQKDIVEVARAFTGWTIADPRGYRRAAADAISGNEGRALERLQQRMGIPADIESGEFYFNDRLHDKGPKTVLGQKVDEGGIKDGQKVIDILVGHPSTARFIARKLAVKFVRDDPSEGLVDRVADAFSKSKGDIRATLSALFSDKEFFAPENYRAKIKTPFELAVSSIRVLGGETNASPAFLAMLDKLGEVPYGYQAPTGYPDKAEDWVNTGALLERLNYAVAVASNRIPGTRLDLSSFPKDERDKVLDHAIAAVLNGDISKATRASLGKQIERPLPEVQPGSEIDADMTDDFNMRAGRMRRQARLLAPSGDPDVFTVVSLVLGTPEFQRQ